MKKTAILAIVFLLLLLLFPSLCVSGAKDGLVLWFNTIIPALFPFIFITNLIRDNHGFVYFERIFSPLVCRLFKTSPGGSYSVIIGFLCGYPMGAKAVCDSLNSGRITKAEAGYILTFVNNPSPVYMISYVSIYILEAGAMGLPVITIVFLTAWITALLGRKIFHWSWDTVRRPAVARGQQIDQNIMSTAELLVRIGGYMMLFSMIARCLLAIDWLPPLVSGILAGLLEQTTGLDLVKQLDLSFQIKTALAMIFICFGGLSITAQTYSVIHSHGLSLKKYIFAKIISGLLAGALAMAYFALSTCCQGF